MDSSTPKISFIPKGSLVREDPFLERRRPRSIIGFFSVLLFILSVTTYAGLYYYNNSLNRIILEKRLAIEKVQEKFNNTPEVSEAKIFRARADVANEILKKHAVVSAVVSFLEKNTTESIMYDKFSFKNDNGQGVLEVSGEAPTYGALSYQADFLRKKGEDLSKFSLNNFSLTPMGSVSFTFSMTFNPGYLLYENNLKGPQLPLENTGEDITSFLDDLESIGGDLTSLEELNVDEATTSSMFTEDNITNNDIATSSQKISQSEKPSKLRSLWEKFKFW